MRTRASAVEPRKRPRQKRSHETVEAILQAAAYILTRDGFAALTTNKVAARAGVNIASLYQYFPNKDALLFELMRRHAAETRSAALAVLSSRRGKGLVATVRALVDAAIASHASQPELHRVFTREGVRFGAGRIRTDVDASIALEGRLWTKSVSGAAPNAELAAWLCATVAHAAVHAAIAERADDFANGTLADELVALITGYLRVRGRRVHRPRRASNP